ncbi:MAG: hypothetical protein AAFR71_10730 [Pseudomonadota bacterium]
MMRNFVRSSLIATAISTTLSGAGAQTLPELNLDAEATTVSGLSSGGFMAVQLQVAFSEKISGAGVVAGGPYGCAEGFAYKALHVCMETTLGEADAAKTVEIIQAQFSAGGIDDPVHLASDRIYLFHGEADTKVSRISMDALRETYLLLQVPEDQITYETDLDVGHGFVIDEGTTQCDVVSPNFLIDCNVDKAGAILNQLYPDLAEPTEPREDGLMLFGQSQYTKNAPGMDELAFIYIPEACAAGMPCRLHIALHGCKQGRGYIQDDYPRLTGYNDWAEANDIVVLYPQAKRIPPYWWNWFQWNPDGCWDWWGYADDDYLSRDAPQIAAIERMAAALGAPLSD